MAKVMVETCDACGSVHKQGELFTWEHSMMVLNGDKPIDLCLDCSAEFYRSVAKKRASMTDANTSPARV